MLLLRLLDSPESVLSNKIEQTETDATGRPCGILDSDRQSERQGDGDYYCGRWFISGA